MNLKALISFRGRAGRNEYLRAYMITFAGFLLSAPVAPVLGSLFGSTVFFASIGLTAAALYALIVLCLAVSVRRLHDRDKSGWWIVPYWALPTLFVSAGLHVSGGAAGPLLQFIGYLLAGAVFVELGFLEGTKGSNAHGQDPAHVPPPLPVAIA